MKKHLLFVFQSVVAGLAMALLYLLITGQLKSTNSAPSSAPVKSYASAVQQIAPAVVNIYIQSNQLVPNSKSGLSPAAPYRARTFMGSGVIVTTDGYIVTNKHNIKDAVRIYVSLWNNELHEAHISGQDDLTDLAVLKIQGKGLSTANFADSDAINTGDVVLAIGNPFGLNQSVSLGIVSATGRRGLDISPYENFIQTDAAINQGNSGGALVNTMGELVGLGTATYNHFGAEGISFAIPSNTVQQIVNSIVQYGEVRRGWFGLSFYNPQVYFLYGIKKPDQGVRISSVYPGSAAALAGLKKNDVVTHINDESVNSYEHYTRKLWGFTVGDQATLHVQRGAETLKLQLTVETPPDSIKRRR